jgi:hypothetical protein
LVPGRFSFFNIGSFSKTQPVSLLFGRRLSFHGGLLFSFYCWGLVPQKEKEFLYGECSHHSPPLALGYFLVRVGVFSTGAALEIPPTPWGVVFPLESPRRSGVWKH